MDRNHFFPGSRQFLFPIGLFNYLQFALRSTDFFLDAFCCVLRGIYFYGHLFHELNRVLHCYESFTNVHVYAMGREDKVAGTPNWMVGPRGLNQKERRPSRIFGAWDAWLLLEISVCGREQHVGYAFATSCTLEVDELTTFL